MGDWLYRVGALLLLAAVAYYALRAYHQRELARIETAHLELADYVKIAVAAVTFAWQCPRCGTPLLTAEALTAHQASSSSACAWFSDRAREERDMAEARAERAAAVREDSWPALGAEPAEIGE
jgi:hypothetical protein